MRPEDIRKIRKRIDTTLSNFRSVYGCYVNGAGEIVSTMEIPVLDMETEEREMYAAILKKALSGTQDRNQLSIVLSTDMVNDSDDLRAKDVKGQELVRGIDGSAGVQRDIHGHASRAVCYRIHVSGA